MKRILVVNPISSWGGASVALMTVLDALKKSKKYEFVVLFRSGGASFDEFRRQGYECITVPFPSVGTAGGQAVSCYSILRFTIGLILSGPKIAAFLYRQKFDCAYMNTGVCLGFAIYCRLFRVPVVWHIRELLENKTVFGRFLCTKIARLSVVVIANSVSSASVIPESRRLEVIYDGIPEIFSETVFAEQISLIKKQWGFPEDTVVFGLFSAISWAKGHYVLLKALTKVVKECPWARVVFIGGTATPSNYHRTLRARIKKLMGRFSDAEEYLKVQVRQLKLDGFVVFDGWRDGSELVERYAACDVVVCPSTIPEGFGRPVVEGALAGKPTIGVNAGSLPELVKEGLSGWLVPMNDEDSLAGRISIAAKDLSTTREMGLQARGIALGKFTTAIHDKNILNVFEAVCGKEYQNWITH